MSPVDNYNKIVTTVNSVTSDYTFEVDKDNLIVIDTSNNRIGINTVYPQRSIHISGGDVNNGIITPYLQMISGGNVEGDFIPINDNSFSLGSVNNQWKDLYVGPGSIYMDKQKIFSLDDDNNLNLNISGDGLNLDSNLDLSGYIHNTNNISYNVNISGNFIPTSDNKYSLGDNTKGWKEIYLCNSSIKKKNDGTNNIVFKNIEGFTIDGNLEITGNLFTLGRITIDNEYIASSYIANTPIGTSINGTPGDSRSTGHFTSIDATLNSTFQKDLNVNQDLIVQNDISVNQKLKVGSDVSLNNKVDINNHLTVNGDVSLNSNVDISNHLNVKTTSTNDLIVRNSINFYDSFGLTFDQSLVDRLSRIERFLSLKYTTEFDTFT